MKNLSVGKRLAAAFAVLFALMVAVALMSFLGMRTMARMAGEAITQEAIVMEQSRMADAHTLGLRRFEKDIFLNLGAADKEGEYLAKWKDQRAQLDERLQRLERMVMEDEDRAAVAAMKRSLAAYGEGLNRVLAQAREGTVKTPAQANAAIGGVKDEIRSLEAAASQLAQKHSQLLAANEKDLELHEGRTLTRMAVALAVALVLGLAAAIVLTRSLTRDIGAAVQHVQSSSTQLQSAANQQATASREQAAATNETTTTIRELVATARQIAESAQRVTQIAERTAAAARSGEGTVQRAQEGLAGIKRQVDLIVGHMLELGRKSQQIGGILDIINELAEQTNILAINATIEAAGAGEAGKRFAVVADEIRKLADRVGGSTKDIRSLIEEIRTAVNTTVMATEQGSKAVDDGGQKVGEVAAAFTEIAGMVATTSEAAREIELSTKQQTTAVEQVNVAMANVAQAAKETEASSSETLQTASQLTTLSRDLTRMIRAQA